MGAFFRVFAKILQHKKLIVLTWLLLAWERDHIRNNTDAGPRAKVEIVDYEFQETHGVQKPVIPFNRTCLELPDRKASVIKDVSEDAGWRFALVEWYVHGGKVFGYWYMKVAFLIDGKAPPILWVSLWSDFGSCCTILLVLCMLFDAAMHKKFEPDTMHFHLQVTRLKKEKRYQRSVYLLLAKLIPSVVSTMVVSVVGLFACACHYGGMADSRKVCDQAKGIATGSFLLIVNVAQQILEERRLADSFYPDMEDVPAIHLKKDQGISGALQYLITPSEDTLERIENAYMAYLLSGARRDTRHLDTVLKEGYDIEIIIKIYEKFGKDVEAKYEEQPSFLEFFATSVIMVIFPPFVVFPVMMRLICVDRFYTTPFTTCASSASTASSSSGGADVEPLDP